MSGGYNPDTLMDRELRHYNFSHSWMEPQEAGHIPEIPRDAYSRVIIALFKQEDVVGVELSPQFMRVVVASSEPWETAGPRRHFEIREVIVRALMDVAAVGEDEYSTATRAVALASLESWRARIAHQLVWLARMRRKAIHTLYQIWRGQAYDGHVMSAESRRIDADEMQDLAEVALSEMDSSFAKERDEA